MTFWEWLHGLGPGWPDQRGWYALALFVQTCVILIMLAMFPALTRDEFFKSIATAIVVTGWVGFAVAGRDNRIDREQVGQLIKVTQDQAAQLIRQPGVPS
jgi:hypothetical protein